MSKNDHKSTKAHLILLFAGMSLVALVAIVWSLVKVQWVEGDMWREKAVKKARLLQDEPAKRGNIYSSDGKLLATTVPVCDLYMDMSRRVMLDRKGNVMRDTIKGDTLWSKPIRDKDFDDYVDTAAHILNLAFPDHSTEYWKYKLESLRNSPQHPGCAEVCKGMPYSYWMEICRLPGWSRGVVTMLIDGTSVIHNMRFHTYENLAASVVGFQPSISKEVFTGLEGYYDSILRGQDGKVLCRRLTRGVWLPMKSGSVVHDSETEQIDTEEDPEHPTIDGSDIVATIDTRFQDIAHYSLERQLERLGASAGCAILMEVETGNVLVSCSLVRDSLGRYDESPYRNVPVKDRYEPGSVFKPVILMAMYNDPTVPLDTAMILPVGSKHFSAYSNVVTDHDDTRPSQAPLWKAVMQSSNVAFCELAWRHYNGNRRDTLLAQVGDVFPFEKLNVDLKGTEYECITHTLHYDNDFLRFNYGYTAAVSPLRLATFYNALANNGRMVRPRFCKAIVRNGVVEELPVVVLRDSICSRETAKTLRDMLVGVVEGGTGDNIRNENYSIAGKTGTAETYPGSKLSNATFVGFFPADKPKYTCLVLYEDVKGFGRAAAPVFERIANCVVSVDKELDCRPSIEVLAGRDKKKSSLYKLPIITKAPQAEVRQAHKRLGLDYSNVTTNGVWCTFQEPVDSLGIRAGYLPYQLPRTQVPNCTGMTLKDALLLCRSMGLDVTFEGVGKVSSQSPRARTPLSETRSVHLVLK